MGRKNYSKAKDKKMKRKQESAKKEESFERIKAANNLEDPLSPFAIFKKYERNGLSISLETKKVTEMDKQTFDWAFALTQTDMQTHYEKSEWGWKTQEMKEEMKDDQAWYLLARDQDSKPVAFSHFRFEMEGEMEGKEVLYCYEIQLIPSVRKKGLGKFMIQVLELMANKHEMKCVMCTVFKHKDSAEKFFVNKLNYTVEETNLAEGVYDEEDFTYQILSKLTKHGQIAAKEAELCAKRSNKCCSPDGECLW